MSESRVIALRFRPKTFGQVVGQEPITRTLSNAIKSNTLHHAYLFAGARGVGKTTTARILAKSLNCVNAPTTDPCGQCPSCVDIASSNSTYVREIDAASNTGVDNVRDVIITSAAFSPPPGQYKIFIIDEVHQLSGAAFNALLKTIEEPPPRVVFIMATTEIQKVPDTILSRCQIFEFRTIPLSKITAELKRIVDEIGVKASDSALATIARAGEGSMRDAESALDQVISFAGDAITDDDVSNALGLVSFETLNITLHAIADHDSGEILRIVDTVVSRGYDLRNFCRDLMSHLRSLLVIKVAGPESELIQLPPSEARGLAGLAVEFSEQDLIRFFSILSKTEQDIRLSSQQRFQLEIGLVKLAHAGRLRSVEEMMKQLASLESRLTGQTPAAAAPGMNPSKGVDAPLAESPKPAGPRPVSPPPIPVRPRPEDEPRSPIARPAPAREPQRGRTEAPQSPGRSSAPPTSAASGGEARQAATYSVPPEPPGFMDEPPDDDGRPRLPSSAPPEKRQIPPAASSPASGSDEEVVEGIKKALESKRKMIIVSALDHAESIKIDGEYLRVVFAPSGALFKGTLESAQSKAAIQEATGQVTGRRLVLAVSTSGSSAPTSPQNDPVKAQEANGERPEAHPAVLKIVEKFQGEVVEVIKPKP
jgi:DNA polymerase-3 subunit gamma/tau